MLGPVTLAALLRGWGGLTRPTAEALATFLLSFDCTPEALRADARRFAFTNPPRAVACRLLADLMEREETHETP